MVEYVIQGETLTEIAGAIRTKNGGTRYIPTTSMAEEILAIETEPTLQDKTVDPTTYQQIVEPDAGYDGFGKVTVNAVGTAEQATPGISVDSNGLITASATQAEGYVAAGTKSATKQLSTQAAQTITPGTSDKTIASGKYLTGVQTIKGDSDLKPENIMKGVDIFGVVGALEKGVIVQKKTGAFTTEAGTTSVTLGFRPDFVAVYGGIWKGYYNISKPMYAGALFDGNDEYELAVVVPGPETKYIYSTLVFHRYDTGFSVYCGKTELTANNSRPTYDEAGRTFNYVAIKYT